MFFNQTLDGICAIDASEELTYRELNEFTKEWHNQIQQRTLIFILCENSIGAMVGYVASLSNRIVPLLLSASMNIELLDELIDTYQPQYIWGKES